ncbi:MAG: hypothetical protein Q9M46_00340 [Ghiorsea sp.]|nr:hypothetical protein [Ghiorsea sp.]
MRLNFLLAVLLVLAGCGLKTNLVVYDDSAPMPQIANLSYQVHGDKLELALDIAGGSGTVLYQIDRTEVEPDCQCIGHWLRYYESTADTQRKGLVHHIKLRQSNVVYAFRLRVKDSLGRVSGWSQVLKASAEKKLNAKAQIKVEGNNE